MAEHQDPPEPQDEPEQPREPTPQDEPEQPREPTPQQRAVMERSRERTVGRKRRLGKPIPSPPDAGQESVLEPPGGSREPSDTYQATTPSGVIGPPEGGMEYFPRHRDQPKAIELPPQPEPEQAPKRPSPKEPEPFRSPGEDRNIDVAPEEPEPSRSESVVHRPPVPAQFEIFPNGLPPESDLFRSGPDGGGPDSSQLVDAIRELADTGREGLDMLREMLSVLQEIKTELPSIGGLK